MGYNDGVFSLFNQSVTVSNRYADLQAPTFSPPSGVLYQSVYAKSVAPTILTTVSGTISFAYAQQITGSISASSIVSSAYGLNISGPLVQAGTVSNAYSLYALAPSVVSGNIVNQVGAFFGLPTSGVNPGGVGIGTSTPMNALDVSGGMAVGSYAGSQGVNSGVLAVSGSLTTTEGVGVGTSNPAYYLDVQGTFQGGSAYGWMPQGGQQKTFLAFSSCTSGESNPGTEQLICANTTTIFDLSVLNSLFTGSLQGFNGALFDGRYVYFLPRYGNALVPFGILVRYDSTLPFSSSNSYSLFDLQANVSSFCTDLTGGFDGRYLYLCCGFGPSLVHLTNIVRYDTLLPFNSTSSYQLFNASTINPGASLYRGAIFDGQYVYFTAGATTSNIFVRYNTTAPFLASQSWSIFNPSSLGLVSTTGANIVLGSFDGRYVYLNPSVGSSASSSFLTRYDTTLPFSVSNSYQVFDLLRVPGNQTCGYTGGCFDGRYYYLGPNVLLNGLFSSQMLRYDTAQAFTSSVSYSIFSALSLNTLASSFGPPLCDGRYVYYQTFTSPTLYGISITYDTNLPWGMTTSYSVFDFKTISSSATGLPNGVYNGTYCYRVTQLSTIAVRTAAYPSTPLSAMAIGSQALNGFTLGSGIMSAPTSGTASAGSFAIPSLPAGYIMFTGSRGGVVKIPYF